MRVNEAMHKNKNTLMQYVHIIAPGYFYFCIRRSRDSEELRSNSEHVGMALFMLCIRRSRVLLQVSETLHSLSPENQGIMFPDMGEKTLHIFRPAPTAILCAQTA